METRLASRGREVVISGDNPFVIIGERINPTGRKVLAAEMKDGVMDRVRSDAQAQAAAGAHMLDVNAGIPANSEIVNGQSANGSQPWSLRSPFQIVTLRNMTLRFRDNLGAIRQPPVMTPKVSW